MENDGQLYIDWYATLYRLVCNFI